MGLRDDAVGIGFKNLIESSKMDGRQCDGDGSYVLCSCDVLGL